MKMDFIKIKKSGRTGNVQRGADCGPRGSRFWSEDVKKGVEMAMASLHYGTPSYPFVIDQRNFQPLAALRTWICRHSAGLDTIWNLRPAIFASVPGATSL